MDRAFAALGEPVRRRILVLLGNGEQPAGALAVALHAEHGISQPAVSQHLGVLRGAGLVAVRADGTRRIYSLDPAGIAAVQRWLGALTDPLAVFDQPLDALETEVARGRRRRRSSEGASAVS